MYSGKVRINSRELAVMDQAVADAPYEWTFPSSRYSMTGEIQPSAGTLTGWSQNVPPRLRSSVLLNSSALGKLTNGYLRKG
jgi:hypothetical protein